MKVGSLVKYVGSAAMYRDRVGVVTQTYGFIESERLDSALVHFVGLEGKGRDAPGPAGPWYRVRRTTYVFNATW